MARQIMLRDYLYERLSELKGSRSFSQIIQELLENQNRLLSELLNEVRSLNRRLSSLRLEVKEAQIREVKAVTGITDKKLPSFIQDNPWVEILSERR